MTKATMPGAFFGWHVVAATFVLAVFGWGAGFYGPPIFLQAVVERTGWPVPLVSAAVTTHFLVGVPVVANMPLLYRLYGIAVVTAVGVVLLAVGIVGWSIAAAPWQLFAAALVSGCGWVTMGAAAVNALVANWFVRSRPAALATAYNGASIGGVVFSPLWVALIGTLGFATATAAVGLLMVLVVGLLSFFVFAKTPEHLGQAVDGGTLGDHFASSITSPAARALPGRTLWRDPAFLTLAAGMALSLFAQIGLLSHLYSLLTSPLDKQAAGIVMGLATACAIGGRTAVGWCMSPNSDRRRLAAINLGIQLAGSLAMLLAGGTNVPLLILGVVLFGIGIGNVTSLPPLIAQVEFVKEDAGRVVPLIVAIGQATYAFAPAAFGVLRAIEPDVSGNVSGAGAWMFATAAVVQLAALTSFLIARRKAVARVSAG